MGAPYDFLNASIGDAKPAKEQQDVQNEALQMQITDVFQRIYRMERREKIIVDWVHRLPRETFGGPRLEDLLKRSDEEWEAAQPRLAQDA